MPVSVQLTAVEEIGPFTFRWPEGIEHFERGWQGTAEGPGGKVQFRYGLGARTVYGRPRAHSVVWLGNQPVAEGVAADDHASSRSLVSRIKGPDRKVVRDISSLPDSLVEFEIVQHREAIDAPWSPRCLAVKLAEDDVGGWSPSRSSDAHVGGWGAHPIGLMPRTGRTPMLRSSVRPSHPVHSSNQSTKRPSERWFGS
jgi:hypothetical protein